MRESAEQIGYLTIDTRIKSYNVIDYYRIDSKGKTMHSRVVCLIYRPAIMTQYLPWSESLVNL